MRARVMMAGLVVAGVVSCGGDPAPVETRQLLERDANESTAADAANRGVAGVPASPRPEAKMSATEETSVGRVRPDATSTMIIRTGNAGLEVDRLDPGITDLRRVMSRLGGYVANVSLQGGKEQVRQASLELKVPAERFDELTGALEPIGRVEFLNVTAEDVGEEFVDLTARAANARRLEARLLDLLGSRTGKLQDVLSVERELARVREEIERIDGRLRYLRTRASMSTLTVTIHEPFPIVGDHPGRSLVLEALRQAWRNFASVLAASIASLGYLVPVGALVWGVVVAGRRRRRQPA